MTPPVLCALRSLVGGGVERTALTLQRHLDGPHRQIWLALMENYGELLESAADCPNLLRPPTPEGTPPQREDLWFAIRALPRVASYARRIHALNQQLRPRVIFTHSGVDLLAAARIVPRGKTKWAAGVGSDLLRHLRNQQPYLEPAWRVIMGVLYRGPDVLVTTSQGLRRALIDELWLNPERIRVIPNPVDLELVQRNSSQSIPEDETPFVLGVGRLSYYKGFDVLVRAMALLKTPLKLILLGDGEERERLEATARQVGFSNLHMPGFVDNPWAYMKRAAALVVPSRLEGFSNVTVEALACGAPVIVTDCPHGPREIISEGRQGLLVPHDNEVALAGALDRIGQDQQLNQELRRVGPPRAAQFAAPAVAGLYNDFFQELSGGR